MPLTLGSLFSGYGGMDLGLEAAGFKCSYQVEIAKDARHVLAHYWPSVPKHDDIRTFEPRYTDIIAGGFPCQNISSSGRKEGIKGDKSGLWSEYFRIVREVRPKAIIVENVADLVSRGLQRVLSDLASIGFDAGWRVFCSAEFGFPYMRKRLFLVASPNGQSESARAIHAKVAGVQATARDSWERTLRELARNPRVVNGFPGRVQRCRGIGNAVVPAMAEWVGRRVLESFN